MKHLHTPKLLLVISILVGIFSVAPAHAERLIESLEILEATNTIYAFARAQETVSITMAPLEPLAPACATSPEMRTPISVTVDGPADFTHYVALSPAQLQSPSWQTFTFTAPTEGIYKFNNTNVTFNEGADPAPICPGISLNRHYLDISISNAGTPILGRVYADTWNMNARLGAGTYQTLQFNAVRDDGYQYQVTQTEFNGVSFSIHADAFGNTPAGQGNTCVSGYASYAFRNNAVAPPHDALGELASSECGGRFHIYVNTPDPTMPATTTNWDDTEAWLLPPAPQTPSVESSEYTNLTTDTYEGTLDLTINNYYGNAYFLIDIDNNGSYEDDSDRRIQFAVTREGKATAYFDGLDASGDIIPLTQTITGAIELSAIGEIHFVASDVEYRRGIQILRLNGSEDPTQRDLVFWNDSYLIEERKSPHTADLDGTPDHSLFGVHSSLAPDVHGWCPTPSLPCVGEPTSFPTYGDIRLIDDWTYDAPLTLALRTQFIEDTEFVIPEPMAPPSVPNTGFWTDLGAFIFEYHLWAFILIPIAIVGTDLIRRNVQKSRAVSFRSKKRK